MRIYRGAWSVAVTLTVCVSIVAGSTVTTPWIFVAEAVAIGSVGAAFGASWQDDSRKRMRAARSWALRGAAAAVILTGLSPLLGAWSPVVLLALGGSAPEVALAVARRSWRGRDQASGEPRGLTDEQLDRRWKYTTIAVHSSWRSPTELMALVQERQQLLDELERRDPDGFRLWLVSGGWRQVQGQ